MVSCCFCYEPWWAYALREVLELASVLMICLTPIAICVVVWDVFLNHTESRQEVTVLGLEASTPIYLPTHERTVSVWRLLFYLVAGVSTFGLGVLIFDAVQALR
jgi:hypothetical protein